MGKIILDLDLTEYESDFISEEPQVKNSGLWQQAASVRLADRLREMGIAAREYKKKRIDGKDCQKEKLSCYHHAIFISGTRGAGKTIFLRNIEAIWKEQKKHHSDPPELFFIDTIDPTLLYIEDKFSEVVIASVYVAVEKKLKSLVNKECYKDTFLQALNQLSNALGNKSDFEDLRGIDRIQKHRSGIHLERYFHQFLIASVKILGCDALVLPIDDLDMKIDNAFGVLDDIRCLLSCPLILPIVSGDNDLYQHTTTMKFEGILAKNKDASNFEEGKTEAKNLSHAYLTKIFPIHDRLPLQPISQLLPNLSIKYNGSDNNEPEEYKTYHEKFISLFYALCHDAEYREKIKVASKTGWLEPQNARELVQRVRLFHPLDLKNINNQSENKKLWQRFKGFAEIKRKGQALVDSISYLYIHEVSKAEELSLYNLISFNPIMQSEIYSWGEHDYYHMQNRYRSIINGKKDYKHDIKDINKENSSIKRVSQVNTLWEMPPIEFNKFYFNSGVYHLGNGKKSEEIKKIELIYTHKTGNNRYEVLFGRAFEILFWSLLSVTNNIKEEHFNNLFPEIFKRYPFFSYLVFDADDIGIKNIKDEKIDSPISNGITQEIIKWINENRNSLAKFKNKNLIPLLVEVFYNVFSQLHRMKVEELSNICNERLSHTLHRFEYIFINSLLCCMKTNKIMFIDVAITDSSEKIQNRYDFLNSNENMKINFSNILEINKKNNRKYLKNVAKEPFSDIGQLLEVMWEHPIFKLTDKCQEASNYRIRRNPRKKV
ncbi:antiviral RADAR system adenosine triphosphatase RdrA [Brenneria populi subsp. brevivirga]|uniref:antiviral RADAR system adenosine triphosphatase RdrA n=1 Tax=Brenneria populi TaxID=1505588 RepID=UPI002E17D280|nr:antiviral RADAR system adenosine triphosphatase RdrA [Brenneria populi subsp. brevivirga]